MLAVIKTGGKQYKVASGDVLTIEKLAGEVGDTISLGEVLAVIDGAKTELDASKLAAAKVGGEILRQGRGEKVIVFKKNRRQNYRRKNGHRQSLTTVRVGDIALDGNIKVVAAPEKKAAKPAAEKVAKPAAEKAPAKKAAAPKASAAKADATKKPAAKKAPAKSKKDA